MALSEKKCEPCEAGTPALSWEESSRLGRELHRDWQLAEDNKLTRMFEFKDFKASMNFVNKIGEIAEKEGHHPDISIFYNKVLIELWTHNIGGLSENDFILAAKIDRVSSK